MNANLARKLTQRGAVSVPASQTDSIVAEASRQTAGALQSAMRLDIFTGVTTVAVAITAKHQHSNMPGLWTDGKTVSITASTQKSAVVSASADTLTIAAHGYAENQPIVISATVMPDGLQPKTPYWVRVIDANTIQLKGNNEGSILDITTNGTSVSATAVRVFTISYQAAVAGDQAHMPIRASGRTVVTTGVGDSVDIISVIINQED